MPVRMDFVSNLSRTLERFSFSHFGFTPLEVPVSLDLYRDWLTAGHHGSMDYLQKHLPLKAESQLFAPRAHSAIVVAKDYHPHPYPAEPRLSPRTAMYAQGQDYHLAFKKELEAVAESFRLDYVNEEFLCFTDSAPILERDLAARAALGWVGKNSCLIHPRHGSLFFIGEILTSLKLPSPESQIPDFCGTCDRCIRACPTQALEAPRVLNARKCISYWTIESKDVAPLELRSQFADWFFGCDICQTVCPWNEKVFGREQMTALSAREVTSEAALIQDLRWILTSSNKTLSKTLAHLPYSRARANGLKRNSLYVIGNMKLHALRAEVLQAHKAPHLTELANWTLSCLDAIDPRPS
jgi:epoxyqueuosine reductase